MDDDLDALTSKLSEGFQVDPTALGEHPRYSQFKNLTKTAQQQAKRRQEALERQKNGRFEKLMKLRNLAYDDITSDDDEEVSAKAEDAENVAAIFGDAEQRRHRGKYADQLMLSEWLVDIPESLSTEWTMVMAPQGKRTLVVASRGFTTSYNKAGRQMSQFQSRLPGGSSKGKGGHSWTILDCICNNHVYYVLDLLSWNGHEYHENPFDFRQFMLQSKLEESPELAVSTTGFRNVFVGLPKCACSREAMEELMQTKITWRLDGLLFYHNSVIYEPGQSALVGWLKPWMLPEILNVPVPEKYDKESKGQTSAQYIENFNRKHHHTSQIDKSMEQD
uniref:Snurportin-1 n=1 Tax=Caenorhabditis japonica TaxID=281687 RepID=A0A8R1DP61_CAEJA